MNRHDEINTIVAGVSGYTRNSSQPQSSSGKSRHDEIDAIVADIPENAVAESRYKSEREAAVKTTQARNTVKEKRKNLWLDAALLGTAGMVGQYDKEISDMGKSAYERIMKENEELKAAKNRLETAKAEQKAAVRTTERRDELIRQLTAQTSSLSRRREILDELAQIDEQLGNVERPYDAWQRASYTVGGALKNTWASVQETALTGMELIAKFNSLGAEYLSPEEMALAKAMGISEDEFKRIKSSGGDDEVRQKEFAQDYARVDRLMQESAHEIDTAKAGLGELGRAGIDIATNLVQMGADAAGRAVGLGMFPFFARAAGGGAYEARQEGATLEQRAGYGLATGTIEVFTEKMYDGTAKLFGKGMADDVVEKVIQKLTKSNAGMTLMRTIAGAAGEGTEEVVSDLLNPFAQMIYNDTSLKETFASLPEKRADMLYDYLIGFALGGLGSGGSIITGQDAAKNRARWTREVESEELYNDQQAALENIRGQTLSNGYGLQDDISGSIRDIYKQAGVELSDTEASLLADGYTPAGGSAQEYIFGTLDAYRMGGIGLTLEQAEKNSEYAAQLHPDQFKHAWEFGSAKNTDGQKNTVPESGTESTNVNTEEGRERLVSALATLGSHATEAADAYESGQDISTYATAMNKAASLYAAHGADLKAIVRQARDGETADIVGTLTDAQVETAMQIGQQMQAKSRETIKQLDAQFKSIRERAATLQNKSKTAPLSPANAGTSPSWGSEGIDRSIEAARKELAEVQSRFSEKLDAAEGEDAENAYAELEALADTMNKLDSEIKALEAATSQSLRDSSPYEGEPLEGSRTTQRKKGTVSFDGAVINGVKYKDVDRRKLTRQQKNIVAMVERLADLINIDYVFFDGKGNMGGYYQGGKIYININSGMVKGLNKHIAAASLSHELTHFMQDYAPAEYEELKSYVVSAILKKSAAEFDRLVQQQMEWEPGLKYEQIVDELVANACQTMLLDDRAVTKLARQNMSLAEKVADVLEEITAKIKAAFEEIDFSTDMALFRPVQAVMDEMDAIAERWSDGIAAATENYNAVQTAGIEKAAPESSVRYQKIGVNDYGEEIYETSEQLRGLSYAEKLAIFKANFYTPGTPQYIGQRIRFQTKTGTYFAEIDRFTQRENTNKINPKKMNPLNKAKVNVGAAGDFVTLLENAQVDKENVPNSKQNNDAKKHARYFDYFFKNVEVDGKRFGVFINIRSTDSGKYVYEVSFRPIKKELQIGPQTSESSSSAAEAKAPHRSSDKSISEVLQNSKGKFQMFGIRNDGIEVYETSEETKALTWKQRRQQFLRLMENEYRGRTAKFVRNGHAYYATFARADINKNIYGDNKSDAEGHDAKINAGADGDIFDLVENSRYDSSEAERGKSGKIHRSANRWDYYIKTVQIDGRVFDLRASVRRANNGDYVYSLQLNLNDRIKAVPPGDLPASGDLNGAHTTSKNRLAQIADAVNENDDFEQNSNGKFQMFESVEATDKLVAVHNKSVSGLRRMLQRGGVPFPSIAIKKAGSSHEGFGDVSIVFPRSTIDPAESRWNRLYSNDAWTPTEPHEEYDVGDMWRYMKKLRKALGDHVYDGLKGGSYLEENTIARKLMSNNGDVFEALKDISVLEYAYLQSVGQTPALPERTASLDGFGKYKNDQLLAVFDAVSADEIESMTIESTETLQKIADVLNNQFLEKIQDPEKREVIRRSGKLLPYKADKINPHIIREAYRKYAENGNSIDSKIDFYELDRSLRGNGGLLKDPNYRAWIESYFSDLIKDRGIPNGRDLYTDSGNRRSFKQTHVAATLENITQQMRKQAETGVGFFGMNLRGVASKTYDNVEQMRADSGRLVGTHLTDEVFDEPLNELDNRLHELGQEAAKTSSWSGRDAAEEIMLEAVRDAKSKAQMDRMIRKEAQFINYSPELTEKLWTLSNDARNMPAPFFEAKPRRIVYPEEALAYILPDNADADVQQMLRERGYNVLTYKAGDEQDRLAKLNSVEGARFQHWDNTTDDTAAERNGRELAYAQIQSENAILSETVTALRKQTAKQDNTIGKLQDKLRLTETPEVRQGDAKKLARAIINEYGSRADRDSIAGQIKALGDYLLQTPAAEVSEAELKGRGRIIAAEVLENAYEDINIDSEIYQQIAAQIKGRKLSIDEDFLGELDRDGGFETFRKRNFGRFTLAKRESRTREGRDGYLSVDQFYTDMQGEYGKSFFPDVSNEGEQAEILEQMLDAGRPIEVNPFEQYMGEATESLANRIVMDAMSGVLRPNEPTTTDKQRARTQALREQILQLRDENKLERREAGRLYQTIYDLSLALDKSESKYESLRQAADYRTAQVRAEGRARATEIKASERERAARQVAALKEHYREVSQRAKERREESAGVSKYRRQVDKKAKALYELLMTNSNDKHVPQALKEPLAEFLEALDFSSKRKLAGGAETQNDAKMGAKLLKLQQLLDGQQRSIEGENAPKDDLGGYIDVAPDVLDYLREMAERITAAMDTGRDYTINQMDAADLKGLSKLLSNLTAAIKNMNSFMANARYESVREAASADIDGMEELGTVSERGGNKISKFTMWDNGVPYYVFKRFGKGGQSIFEGFTKGWEKMAFNAQEIISFTEKTYTDKEVREWKHEQHEIELSDGSKIVITTGQIMELSQLLGREQAVKHISKGGIRIGNIKTKKGERADAAAYHLTAEDIAHIVGLLTERQQVVAKELQHFMAERGAEWGNEVSMRRFGYKFYEEGEGYYPIRTDGRDRPMADTDAQQNSMFRLLNLSSSKSLNPKAGNALIVGDIFDTFADHMSDMAKLNGMGLPVLDAIKWFSYKEKISKPDGTFDTRSTQLAMSGAYGDRALHYFRTLMKDINGMTETGDRGADFTSRLLSNAKAASVGANLRVAFLQPTSYVRAQTVLKPQYMVKAFSMKNGYEEAMKYSGSAVWKSLGYYDTDISKSMRGQIQHDDSFRDKLVEKSMALAELGDKLTWGRLWNACKLQAQAESKGLSGKALMQATANLFREVIYSSQVMDATLTRSEIMRGKGVWSKTASAFMAEPTLSYNILLDAYSDYRIAERKHGWAEAWQRNKGKIGKAFIVYTNSAMVSALAESIFEALRDDDDEEFWKKFIEALPGNFFQNMDLIGKLPVLKELANMVQGYSNDSLAFKGVTDTYDAVRIWEETYKLAVGELDKATKVTSYGKMTPWGKIYKSLQAMSELSGIPGANMLRDVIAMWNTLMNGRNDKWKIKRYDNSALSQSKINAWKSELEPLGITKAQFEEFISAADTDGSGSLKQDEVGEYLNQEIAAGNLTQEQAAALWAATDSTWKKTYSGWRSDREAKETPVTAKEVTGYEAFKDSAPIYGKAKTQAAYDVWETQLAGSMTLDRFTDFLTAADTDGNDSLKQDELGYALLSAIDSGELDPDQAAAVWGSQGWKHGFDWWAAKH